MRLFVQLSRSPIKFLSFPFNSNHLTQKPQKNKYALNIRHLLVILYPVLYQFLVNPSKAKQKNKSIASGMWLIALARSGVERRGDVERAFFFSPSRR